MLYEILIYIGMYFIDMFSSILFWKKKPNLFAVAETNQQFKNLLKRFSIPQAITRYTFIVALQFLIIVFLAILITSRIILGNWDFIFSLRFTFVFMTLVHFLGLLTNLISLMKKEIIVKESVTTK
ncbi:hypothetical protein LCGC14_0687730 [marine sediment metagenome]|uniref:Uncharacterized protein n=1 Tax=marine sediment metagenome TaxID=412755 RepID=A0A0F9R6N1_9ZZZZ